MSNYEDDLLANKEEINALHEKNVNASMPLKHYIQEGSLSVDVLTGVKMH
jgi:hypothetical protein